MLRTFPLRSVPLAVVGAVVADALLADDRSERPWQAAAFERFAPEVRTRWDDRWLYIESDGLPTHETMTGIRAWQQQVPLPQPYVGGNAWQVPLEPRPAAAPLSAKERFFRGAIAIAVNGVPIFNPIKNDGHTDTYLAGELDRFGGHSGRADDYHYHLAPVHLAGGDDSTPVAFALDGYPVYGYREPDGSPPRALDAMNGHDDPVIGYHYHATERYPYLNGGFHGEVEERDGEVHPQAHAHPVREATRPLPGATITSSRSSRAGRSGSLDYEIAGKVGRVAWEVAGDGSTRFGFTAPDGATGEQRSASRGRERRAEEAREPWLLAHRIELDGDGDGELRVAELRSQAATAFAAYDRDGDGQIREAERAGAKLRHAMGGFIQLHWQELDGDGDGAVARDELDALAERMFSKSDRDGDGVIAASEVAAAAAPRPPDPKRPPPAQGQRKPVRDASPARPSAGFSHLVGAPTDRSVVLSILSATDLEVEAEFGTRRGSYAKKSAPVRASAGIPCEIELRGLAPATRHYYRLRTKGDGDARFAEGDECTFVTQRAPGASFTFAVQGDSHPERLGKMYDPALYERTLRSVAAAAPDFYFLLGDDFSIERLIERGTPSQLEVDEVYANQRAFLAIVGRSSPLFLVNGNHEQAARYLLDGTDRNPAVLAGRARLAHFPLPAPGGIYTGDATEIPHVGLLRDYFAFEWGDALFVTIDPYWHSAVAVDNSAADGERRRGGKGKRDLWEVGLGDEQYRWLARTLEGSRARWKFVFAHHVLGTGRGGIEQASLYEWGGKDRNGVDRFAEKRPGWAKPVHQLFVDAGVTIFFQGHDHLFARQELDGVVYQSVPNPADATYTAFNREHYRSGDLVPCSGHLRVAVAPASIKVDYVRSVLPGDEPRAGAKDGAISFSYSLPAPAELRK